MPEIQFERSVFDGAPYVRFYYRFQVQRERQLNAQHNVFEKLTTLTSDVLTYSLNPSAKQVTSSTQGKNQSQLYYIFKFLLKKHEKYW